MIQYLNSNLLPLKTFLCTFLFSVASYAQQIETVNGIIPLKNIESIPEGAEYLLLSYTQIPSSSQLQILNERGIEVTGFVPPSSYIVRINNTDAYPIIINSRLFNSISIVPDELKFSEELYHHLKEKKLKSNLIEIDVYDRKHIPVLTSELSRQQIFFEVKKHLPATSLIIHISSTEILNALADISYVSNISYYAGDPQPEYTNFKMQANQIHALNYLRKGPTGTGTFFGNFEGFGGSAKFAMNIHGRNHLQYGRWMENTGTTMGHGTVVNATAMASNNYDEYEDRGMAEGAIAIQMLGYEGIEDYYTNKNLKPLTTNISAGTGASVNYDNFAKEFDRLARNLGGYLHCYSAGNSGGDNNTALAYGPGWANITGDAKTNKNNLTVHSSGNPGEHYDWACKGPVKDGRLKPDICAEGYDGTSFASPGVAGLVNVLYESYQQSYSAAPRSDVVKAVILNTATNADKPGIDYKTGFGIINPVRAHRSIQQKNVFTGSMPQGTSGLITYQLNIPAGIREAKILLYWHDYPGTPGAAKALVNDLDIKVIAPNIVTTLPWVLDPTPGNQYNLPTRKTDNINNVEQVTLTNPQPGIYTIQINGTNVPMGPQDFVVTYDLLTPHIEITSPVKDFKGNKGRDILFTWNASLDTTNPLNTLELILEKQSFQPTPLATIPPNRLYYKYNLPFSFPNSSTARLIIRQKNTGIADTSDYFHVMDIPSNLNFKTICEDKITLSWNNMSSNSGGQYIIYRLGEKYMYPVDTVNYPATTVTLNAANILGAGNKFTNNEWFAISAKHSNGAESIRTLPVSPSQTTVLNSIAPYQKEYTLCYNDTLKVSAYNLTRDSLRWFCNGLPIANATSLNLQLTQVKAGKYFYKAYQQSCVFTSDTFTVNTPLDIADTLQWGERIWKTYVFKGKNLNRYYGTVDINKLSYNSYPALDPLSDQIDDMPNYKGCSPGREYIAVLKRKGFVKGNYQFKLNRADYKLKMWVNGTLVYTSPDNAGPQGIVWQGLLDENSTVRLEHTITWKYELNFEFIASDYATPGNVANGLLIWLDGKYTSTKNNTIQSWFDLQPTGQLNYPEPDASIILKSSGLNFNPVLQFNNSGGLRGSMVSTNSTSKATTISVFNMNSSSRSKARVIGFSYPPFHDDDHPQHFTAIARKDSTDSLAVYRLDYSMTSTMSGVDKWVNVQSVTQPSSVTLYINGIIAGNSNTPYTGIFYNSYNIGARTDSGALNGQFAGDMAEIIHYDRTLSTNETQRIQSYLAIKYGIKIPHNYLSAGNKILYNTNTYAVNIAGIAKDSRQNLLQKQSSSSVSPYDIFTGSLGPIAENNSGNTSTFAQDSTYILWGNNNADLVYSIPFDSHSSRMMRAWKVQQTGDAGVFRFNFDASSFDNTSCAKYLLIISPDENFNASDSLLDLTLYTAGNGKKYLYAEYTFIPNSTSYFSLIRSENNYEPGIVPAQSSVEAIFCQRSDTTMVIDPNAEKKLARIISTAGSAIISGAKIITSYQAEQLANCNDSSVLSVVNRMLELTTNGNDSGEYTVRFYFDFADTIAALHNPVLTGCDTLHAALRWFTEKNSDSLFARIASALPLEWIDPQKTNYGSEKSIPYIEYQTQHIQHVFSAAYYDTVKKEPNTGMPITVHENISVYPNPFTESITVQGLQEGNIISIYNASGQKIKEEKTNVSTCIIQTPEWRPGLYFIVVNGKHQSPNATVLLKK